MTIELKNTDFKELYEFLIEINKKYPEAIKQFLYDGENIKRIIFEELQPQYNEAFLKYKDETQLFNKGERVLFRWSLKHDWTTGKIYKVSRLANGQHKYTISYKENAQDYHYDSNYKVDKNGMVTEYTNPMTNKNIKKYE